MCKLSQESCWRNHCLWLVSMSSSGRLMDLYPSLQLQEDIQIAAMPLSYLECNGRPFGIAAMAARNREDVLLRFMSA
ncbi:hypothetical protein QBC41DRAFT_263227 [Cercophora samala]|uniref:Uncharacterized protein n=1 Tax=Cercophora samala TaxID=330535 RepID=A0AA39YKM1_9PEZI|nr:hypothetical protein QBC41DRAFT_263227 [Cercophora samala]